MTDKNKPRPERSVQDANTAGADICKAALEHWKDREPTGKGRESNVYAEITDPDLIAQLIVEDTKKNN